MPGNYEILKSTAGSDVPLLTHMPHASRRIPARWHRQIRLTDAELEHELDLMTDHFTDELFATPTTLRGVRFVNRVSRLVCDPERFPDDAREPMARFGMGAVYLNRQDGTPLRVEGFGKTGRNEVVESLFRPYAAGLTAEVDRLIERFGTCAILDAHSFPTRPLPYEDPGLSRPDICIGFDDAHCTPELVEVLEECCRASGLSCALNEPFAGSYVPLKHFRKDARVISVMIEVRRELYIHLADGSKSPGYEPIRTLIDDLARRILNPGTFS